MADTQSSNKLLLTGAQVFDPSTSGFQRWDVRIGDGKILIANVEQSEEF